MQASAALATLKEGFDVGGGGGLLGARRVVHFKVKDGQVVLSQSEGRLFKSTTKSTLKRVVASTKDNR